MRERTVEEKCKEDEEGKEVGGGADRENGGGGGYCRGSGLHVDRPQLIVYCRTAASYKAAYLMGKHHGPRNLFIKLKSTF
jgi:hypothetical protein